VHISAIGAFCPTCREIPGATVGRARIFVDSREAVLREAGDILVPRTEGLLGAAEPLTEIGAVHAGHHPGRGEDSEVTLFKSVGLPVEDAVACDVIYQRAVATASGHDITFP
jgi:ornithine cyclodeaminase/alanine dehydrogenase-like protein (mu-crystallin family)